MVEQNVEAMRFGVKQRQRLGQPVIADDYKADVADEMATRFVIAQDEATKVGDKDSVKLPDKFKNGTDFKIYDEVLNTYLNQLTGTTGVPLNYVIHKLYEPEAGALYDNESEEAVANAPLQGNAFDIDNRRVHDIIKSLTIEGPASSYVMPTVDRTKNGRRAWRQIRAHYGNTSYMNRYRAVI
jgi:hypothetical protein